MAKKSFENNPIEPEKKDFKEPQKEVKPEAGKKKFLRIRIKGSVTIWSHRYDGVQEWAEDDPRLLAARGEYELIDEVWK